jgi:predicted lactoylglutathione lyase
VAAGGRPVYAPRDEPWGMHSSMVADPDGNLIEIGSWNRGQSD